jgi:hypothetical protein
MLRISPLPLLRFHELRADWTVACVLDRSMLDVDLGAGADHLAAARIIA